MINSDDGKLSVTGSSYSLALVLFILISFLSVAGLNLSVSEWHRDNDFAHYYITSSILRDGGNPYLENLASRYIPMGFKAPVGVIRATNPPALALVFAPFTYLPIFAGWLCWLGVQLFGFLYILWQIPVLTGGVFSRRRQIFFGCACLLSYPLLNHLQFSQVQLLITALVIKGVVDLTAEKGRGNFFFGLASSFKLFTLPLILISFRASGLKGVFSFLMGFILPYLLAALFFDLQIYQSYFTEAVPAIQSLAVSLSANLSFSFSINYILNYFGMLQGAGDIALSVLNFAGLGIFAFILLYDWWKSGKKLNVLRSTSLCLVCCVLFSPTAWSHYLVLTIPAFIFLLGQESRGLLKLCWIYLLYLIVGLSYGYIMRAPEAVQLVTACWGTVGLGLMVVLLLREKSA